MVVVASSPERMAEGISQVEEATSPEPVEEMISPVVPGNSLVSVAVAASLAAT